MSGGATSYHRNSHKFSSNLNQKIKITALSYSHSLPQSDKD